MFDIRRNFCFIHIPKNGGTSLKKSLELLLIGQHHTAAKYKEHYPIRWEDAFTFSIVRNPWDRLVSIYFFYKYNTNEEVNNHIHEQLPNHFNDFVLEILSDNPPRWAATSFADPFLMHQKNWITDKDDNLIVDYVARFENYEDDMKYIFNKIGIDTKTYHMRKSKRRDRTDYRRYYSVETMQLVSEKLDADIKYFNYKFE